MKEKQGPTPGSWQETASARVTQWERVRARMEEYADTPTKTTAEELIVANRELERLTQELNRMLRHWLDTQESTFTGNRSDL